MVKGRAVRSLRPGSRTTAFRSGHSVLLALALLPALATAQETPSGLDPTLGVVVGTTGIGLEAGLRLGDRFGLRLASGWIPIEADLDDEEDDVTGTVSPPSPIVRLTADYFPWGGVFHLSAGIQHFSGGVTAVAIPTGSFEIGDNEYTPEDLDRIEAGIWGNETAPYLGVGWQKRTGRVQPYGEVGVAITGSPRVSLRAFGPAAGGVDLEADLQEEIRELEDDASAFRVFPHLMFGLRVRIGG